jgi:hypothetical protein
VCDIGVDVEQGAKATGVEGNNEAVEFRATVRLARARLTN